MADTITEFIKNNEQIGMVVKRRNGSDYIAAGQIILAINKSGESGSYESAAYINANHVNISATNTAHLLAGSIVYDNNGKLVLKDSSGAGIYIERQGGSASFGIWDKGNLTGGVMVDEINGQRTMQLLADVIDIQGIVNELTAYDLETATFHSLNTIVADGEAQFNAGIDMNGSDITSVTNLDADYATFSDVTLTSLTVGNTSHNVSWRSTALVKINGMTDSHRFLYAPSGLDPTGGATGRLISSYDDITLHYLGY